MELISSNKLNLMKALISLLLFSYYSITQEILNNNQIKEYMIVHHSLKVLWFNYMFSERSELIRAYGHVHVLFHIAPNFFTL